MEDELFVSGWPLAPGQLQGLRLRMRYIFNKIVEFGVSFRSEGRLSKATNVSTSINFTRLVLILSREHGPSHSLISVQWWSTNRDIIDYSVMFLVIVVVECVRHL